jgi:putative DNA primase/helicase
MDNSPKFRLPANQLLIKPFNPREEATVFLNRGRFIFMHEAIHEYENGYYCLRNDRTLRERIAIQLDTKRDQSRLGKVREVLETAKNILSTQEIKLNPDPTVINVRNGLLDIKTMRLLPHNPSIVFLYQINANYNPSAECPTFKQFLRDTLVDESLQPDEELIRIVQEFNGYCCYIRCPFDKALMFYGEGSNGKNVLLYVFDSLFKGFVSNVNFEEIGKDRFASADFAGKLLNVSGELSASAKLQDGEVKKIISGEPIRAQRIF